MKTSPSNLLFVLAATLSITHAFSHARGENLGLWAGDGNALDTAGTNHGTLVNGATYAGGKINQAFSLDGSDDYVDLPDATATLLSNSHGTITAWVYPTAVGDNDIVAAFGSGVIGQGIGLGVWGSVRIYHHDGAYDWQSSTPVSANVWTFLGYTWDGSTESIYTNGVLSESQPRGTFSYVPGHARIGNGFWADNANYFPGRIDQVMIFREALSAAQMATLAANGDTPYSVRYVNAGNLAPAWPYTNWVTAATNIQDAVDAATAGDTVLVTNGVYSTGGRVAAGGWVLTNRVEIANAVTVISVNGPDSTFIVGEGPIGADAVRGVHLKAGTLSGFTITNGATRGLTALYEDFSAGGVWMESGVLSNCVVTGCAGYQTGGIILSYGCTVTCSRVVGNTGPYGGGFRGAGLIDRCLIANNNGLGGTGGGARLDYGTRIQNCLVLSNVADSGGGLYFADTSEAWNCTIVSNAASWGGGVRKGAFGGTVYNSIVYHNSILPGGGGTNYNEDILLRSCTVPPSAGEGCISGDPQFVDPTAGDFRLMPTSPCIDSGTNQAWMTGATDLDRNPRITGGIVDIGAYEYAIPAPTRIVGVSGNLAFGNVMVGQTATNTMTITNSGNATLTVTNITYPAGFTGAWNGTIAAGAATNVTVTFSPVAVQAYGGPVTANSDATSGGNTISASGTGTPVATVPAGAGTEVSPYQISQLAHLVWMGDNVGSSSGKYYTVQNDIDASATAGWNGGAGFAPIGTNSSTPFMGIFNGNGKVISNLTINRPSQSNVGLFGRVRSSGVVENLGLAGGSVTGGDCVGSLVGYNDGGMVSNCYATAAVTANLMVGGLVGYNAGTMSRCYATGPVTGAAGYLYAGGLVGINYGTVNRCYATGAVTGDTGVGGLAGDHNLGTVSECYSMGAVVGNTYVGGLVGGILCDETVTNSYWNTESSGRATSAGGTGKTTAQMKQQATFAGWDFANVWRITENVTYPLLRTTPLFGGATLFWQHPTGPVTYWELNTNGTMNSWAYVFSGTTTWQIRGVGDIDGDGLADVIWQAPTGQATCWFMNTNGTYHSWTYIYNAPTTWQIRGVGF